MGDPRRGRLGPVLGVACEVVPATRENPPMCPRLW